MSVGLDSGKPSDQDRAVSRRVPPNSFGRPTRAQDMSDSREGSSWLLQSRAGQTGFSNLIHFHRRAFGIVGTALLRALFAKDSDAQLPDFTVDLAKGCF